MYLSNRPWIIPCSTPWNSLKLFRNQLPSLPSPWPLPLGQLEPPHEPRPGSAMPQLEPLRELRCWRIHRRTTAASSAASRITHLKDHTYTYTCTCTHIFIYMYMNIIYLSLQMIGKHFFLYCAQGWNESPTYELQNTIQNTKTKWEADDVWNMWFGFKQQAKAQSIWHTFQKMFHAPFRLPNPYMSDIHTLIRI